MISDLTHQLGQPAETDLQTGRYTLIAAHPCEGSVATPTVSYIIEGVQSINWGPVDWGDTQRIFQKVGGDRRGGV